MKTIRDLFKDKTEESKQRRAERSRELRDIEKEFEKGTERLEIIIEDLGPKKDSRSAL